MMTSQKPVWRALLLGFLGLIGAFSVVQADEMISVSSPYPDRTGDRYERVSLTAAAVQEAMNAPGAEVRQVSEAEAVATAAAHGVTLAAPAVGSPAWGHPWVIVKAGIGLPANLNAEIEVYVNDNWTVGGSAGTGLLGTVFSATVHWRPDATCWGCHGKNLFSLGFGIDNMVDVVGNETDILIAANIDATYIHRFAEHFGWIIGLKIGAGPAEAIKYDGTVGPPPLTDPNGKPMPTIAGSAGSTAQGSYSLGKIEPGLIFFLYTGFSF